MTVRLLSTQIPEFWEAIKYALAQVERFGSDEESLGAYNRVFASLLNDKSQCFIMYAEDKSLKALMITEIREDLITSVRTLYLRCLYAFLPASNEEWVRDFSVVDTLAKECKCSRISFQTSNKRIENIGKLLGFTQKSVNMELEV